MQMYHSGVNVFVISRLRTKAPDIKTTTVVDRSFPFRDVLILYISQESGDGCLQADFESLKLAPWPTLRQKFMNFRSVFALPGDKHEEKISNCSSTPRLVQAHDPAVSVTIF